MTPRPSARVRANRKNALRSTGPKTAAGKARSSCNAFLHGLRGLNSVSDEEVAPLAELIAGRDASKETLDAAHSVAEADVTARIARRLRAIAFDQLMKGQPADKIEAAIVDGFESVVEDILDPDIRAKIRGAAPIDAKELRLISRLTRFVARLRKMQAQELVRRVQRLELYEKNALALRRRSAQDLKIAREVARE